MSKAARKPVRVQDETHTLLLTEGDQVLAFDEDNDKHFAKIDPNNRHHVEELIGQGVSKKLFDELMKKRRKSREK